MVAQNLLGNVETLVTGYVNMLASFDVDVDVYNYPRHIGHPGSSWAGLKFIIMPFN